MRKFVTMVLAVALAATTVAVSATNADAKHRYRPYIAGPSFGFGFGYGFGPRRYNLYPRGYVPVYPRAYLPRTYLPRRAYGTTRAHIQWCSWRYRTYNPATNTYFIRRGVPAACVSPYRYPHRYPY